MDKFIYMHLVADENWAVTIERSKRESITPLFLFGGGICLFSILNWFYHYKNWDISADRAISFNIIYKGSELLIEEFPSSKDFIDTKEKIEKI